jgi:hypothetical protein
MSTDGGLRAISGFLFQVLAGGALRAAGECRDYRNPHLPELDAVIRLVGSGELIHEFADEDLVIRRDVVLPAGGTQTEVTLVQVKFSVAGTANPIGPVELTKIISALAKAGRRLKETGAKVAGYTLVTNRSVTKTAPTLKGRIGPAILKQLKFVTDAKISTWHEAMEHYGRRFGLREHEIAKGRQQLLGLIFESTTSGAAHGMITSQSLLECLGGGAAARPLDPTERALEVEAQLGDFNADVEGRPVRREQLRDLERRCANRALIVFSGPGGTGKTAALRQWTGDLMAQANTAQAAPFVALRTVRGLPEDWLREAVQDWNPALKLADRVEALERLGIANSRSVPVVHLALDGADEYQGDGTLDSRLQRLALWFGQLDREVQAGARLRARLVVTCRDPEEFERDCLMLARSGGAVDPQKKPFVEPFGEFTEKELRELLETNFPPLAATLLPASSDTDFSAADDGGLKQGKTKRPPLTELLFDPVMWRSFCLITDQERERLVQGDAAARQRLAGHFCERFVEKVRQRTGVDRDQLRFALGKVASANRAEAQGFRSWEKWQQPAIEAGLSPAQAQRLRAEAISGGLITPASELRWDWHNDIVENFLATTWGAFS